MKIGSVHRSVHIMTRRGVAFTLYVLFVRYIWGCAVPGATSWDTTWAAHGQIEETIICDKVSICSSVHPRDHRHIHATHAAAVCRRISCRLWTMERDEDARVLFGWHAAWITNFPPAFGKYNRFGERRSHMCHQEEKRTHIVFYVIMVVVGVLVKIPKPETDNFCLVAMEHLCAQFDSSEATHHTQVIMCNAFCFQRKAAHNNKWSYAWNTEK